MGFKEETGNTQSVKPPGRSAGPESQKQSGIEKNFEKHQKKFKIKVL